MVSAILVKNSHSGKQVTDDMRGGARAERVIEMLTFSLSVFGQCVLISYLAAGDSLSDSGSTFVMIGRSPKLFVSRLAGG